jgi:hypothetical protein
MDTALLRRYLRPSPTLRWHPWAPLAAGALLLLLVFYLGAMWGYSATTRIHRMAWVDLAASEVYFQHHRQATSPALGMLHDAGKLDGAVARYVAAEAHLPGRIEQWRRGIESALFFHGMGVPSVPNREYTVKLAEFRLAEYSASNPRWNVTAEICNELRQPGRSGQDYIEYYKPIAARYSQLLGRTVRAEDLAPAVPGGKCVF